MRFHVRLVCLGVLLIVACAAFTSAAFGAGKKIVFVAGPPSHGYAAHEHHAGCLLLAKCLRDGIPGVETAVFRNGWPRDPASFDGADAIVVFSDGSDHNPMLPHLDEIDAMMKRGVGLACLHYAVEVPKGKAGDLMKQWIGGCFETFWSVNPMWTAKFQQFPEHAIARGLRPFAIDDEWYYHMRFIDRMEGVTPILTAVPPDSTRRGGNDARGGNPYVRARMGMPEHVAWARVRPNGGRGFGFTGGHWHWNWANDGFRTVVLNGIAWTAKLDIPPGGVPSKRPTLEELEANQDKPQPNGFDRDKIRNMIEQWRHQEK
jgi:hypothetical protein